VAVVVAGAVGLTFGGLSAMHDGNSPYASDRPVPTHMGPLVQALHEERVAAAFADYWIAYRLDFEVEERVAVVGVPYNRYEPYAARARAVARPAWIFVSGSAADREFAAQAGFTGCAEPATSLCTCRPNPPAWPGWSTRG